MAMTRFATEPVEDADPRNALLDLFETNVRTMLAHGLEPQMRARLERLLPAPATAPPTAGGPLEREAGDGASQPLDPQEALDLAVVLTALGTRDAVTTARARRWVRLRLTAISRGEPAP